MPSLGSDSIIDLPDSITDRSTSRSIMESEPEDDINKKVSKNLNSTMICKIGTYLFICMCFN